MSKGASQVGGSGAPSDANRARWFLLGSVLVTGAVYTIPYGWYVAYPLVLFSTYVHEIAHGLAAALQVWSNYEGIQADIFDHILAIAPAFDLRVYQSPAGGAVREALSS